MSGLLLSHQNGDKTWPPHRLPLATVSFQRPVQPHVLLRYNDIRPESNAGLQSANPYGAACRTAVAVLPAALLNPAVGLFVYPVFSCSFQLFLVKIHKTLCEVFKSFGPTNKSALSLMHQYFRWPRSHIILRTHRNSVCSCIQKSEAFTD